MKNNLIYLTISDKLSEESIKVLKIVYKILIENDDLVICPILNLLELNSKKFLEEKDLLIKLSKNFIANCGELKIIKVNAQNSFDEVVLAEIEEAKKHNIFISNLLYVNEV